MGIISNDGCSVILFEWKLCFCVWFGLVWCGVVWCGLRRMSQMLEEEDGWWTVVFFLLYIILYKVLRSM